MYQTVIVYFIIILAITYSVYAVIKNVRKKEVSGCGDCNGCDIKREITKNLKIVAKEPGSCDYGDKASEFTNSPLLSKDPATCGRLLKK